MDWSSMVTVGRIIRPQGNRGEVVVAVETDFPEVRFAVGAEGFVARDGVVTRMTVTESRPHDARWVVGFEGITSIDLAETLRGTEFRIPAEDLTALGPGAYYVHDLVGCVVQTLDGTRVGTITRVDFGTGAPMLVAMEGTDEVLVPLSEAFVRRVSVADRLVEVDPPPGLIELNKRTTR